MTLLALVHSSLPKAGPVLAVATLLGLACVAPNMAHAQVTVYNDRASFLSATSGVTTIDFNDQVTAPSKSRGYGGSTVTLSGVTFTANGDLFAVSPRFDPIYNLGDGTVLSFQGQGPNILTVSLPSATTAFGLDFGGNDALPFTFTLSTGDTFTFTGANAPTATPTFRGFTSTTAFTSFTISTNDSVPEIDRFSFGSTAAPAVVNPVPEPGEWATMGIACAGLSGLMIRARRKKANDKATMPA